MRLSLLRLCKLPTQELRQSAIVGSRVLRPLKPILSVKRAESWVNAMRPEERAILMEALQKTEIPAFGSVQDGSIDNVTAMDYWKVAVQNGIPFVGFGFLDNAIMIVAGDYVDLTIGVTLGISTMAAAALGNTISDVCGMGSAVYVERIAARLGIGSHGLTPVQLAAPSFRFAGNMGRTIGITVGCLLGMIPLLLLPSKEKPVAEKEPIPVVEKDPSVL